MNNTKKPEKPARIATSSETREMIENLEAEIGVLRAKLAEVERERDCYRAALAEYASVDRWQIRDHDGELCDWIGGGEGPDVAAVALASATESEGK